MAFAATGELSGRGPGTCFFDYEFGSARYADMRIALALSVSSAYGLLGNQIGINTLKHSFDHTTAPKYTRRQDGVWVQDACAHFPLRTWSPNEVLEHTFYTHQPPTAVEMSRLISTHGGSVIVVSLLECLERYAQCQTLLRNSAIAIPEDPRRLNEWSLIMAITSVLNAIDRGLLRDVDAVTIHASGTYSFDDYLPIPPEWIHTVDCAQQMLDKMRLC